MNHNKEFSNIGSTESLQASAAKANFKKDREAKNSPVGENKICLVEIKA